MACLPKLRSVNDEDSEFLARLEQRPEVINRIGGLNPHKFATGYFRIIECDGHQAGVAAIVPSVILDGRDVELVCVVDEVYEHAGIATQSCRLALADFGKPDAPGRMLACVAPGNVGGLRVASKLGFRHLGRVGPHGEHIFELAPVSPAQGRKTDVGASAV